MLNSEMRPVPSRPRILLVDDTELNRDLIGGVLVAAGCEVDTAQDGEEAVAATWSRSYDLVLMDIEMPGMNGFEAAARIRAREGVMSGVKICALTATKQVDAEQVSFWSGIDAFIAKPIRSEPLVTRVFELLADRAADTNDWKPVWRLAVFSKFTDDDDAATYLDELSALLDTAATAINEQRSYSREFFRTIRELLNLSSLLGFDEIAGLCAIAMASLDQSDARCRDPNLLGAIDRARYAINVYWSEQNPTPLADWWAKTRVNVQSLFRGRPPVESQAMSTY